jgi:WD40 repeat protein
VRRFMFPTLLILLILLIIPVFVIFAPQPAAPINPAVPTDIRDGLEVITPQNAHRLREIKTLGRGWIHNVLWSPDNTRLYVVSSAGLSFYTVGEWDNPVFIPAKHPALINAALSPDGSKIALLERDFVRVLDTMLWREIFTYNGLTYEKGYGWNEIIGLTNQVLALRCQETCDRNYFLWDIQSGERITDFEYIQQRPETMSNLSLITAAHGHFVAIQDTTDGQPLVIYDFSIDPLSNYYFTDVDTSSDRIVAASDFDDLHSEKQTGSYLSVWNMTENQETYSMMREDNSFEGVAILPNEPVIALLTCREMQPESSYSRERCEFYHVELYDMEEDAFTATLPGDFRSEAVSMAFSPDKTMLVAADNSFVRIWEVQSGTSLTTLDGFTIQAFDMDFNSDGAVLATSHDSGWEGAATLFWDMKTLSERPSGSIPCGGMIDYQPGGSLFICTSHANLFESWYSRMEMWDVNDLSQPVPVPGYGHVEMVAEAVFSPDGTMLAAAPNGTNIVLMDVATRETLFAFHIDLGYDYPALKFTRDGRLLNVTFSRMTFGSILFDIPYILAHPSEQPVDYEDALQWTGDEPHYETGLIHDLMNTGSKFAYHPDGSTITGFTDVEGRAKGYISLYDAATGQELKRLSENDAWNLVYSPDGQLIAISYPDCEEKIPDQFCPHDIELLDAETGDSLAVLTGHPELILELDFSPDGKYLISSGGAMEYWFNEAISQDTLIHVWAVPSGEP